MALGIDIGGANLKLADDTGLCRSIAFPMWTEFGQLGFAVRKLIHDFANIPLGRPLAGELGSELAVTMTGELADCFATRREGVRSILEQLCEALPEFQISVYAVGGRWLCPESAIGQPWEVAASNWYALAEWLLHSQVLCGTDNSLLAGPLHRDERLLCSQNFENTMEVDLMIDVGSTTVDIIPIHAGRVATPARTDRGRLQLGQLVYSGMQRTPIAALVQVLAIDDVPCPVMAERFATTDDAYLALGLVAEAPQDHDSADGRPRTVACARARLARMVGEDSETLAPATIDDMARQILNAQAGQIARAVVRNLSHVYGRRPRLLISGHGRPLLEKLATDLLRDAEFMWLDQLIGPAAARSAPALAAAWLFKHRRST